MKRNRLANTIVVVSGIIFLLAAPAPVGAQSNTPPVSTKKMASAGVQPKKASSLEDDFAGLNYTDEQKAQIEKIRQDTKAREQNVKNDDKLTADQKDAMLVGYSRMQYGMMYKVLTPEQKRQVQQKIRARRAAEQAAPKKAPHNQIDVN